MEAKGNLPPAVSIKPVTWFGWLLSLVLVLLTLGAGPWPELNFEVPIILALVLLLESQATPVPPLGILSGATACYLAAVFRPELGPKVAIVLVLAGLAYRRATVKVERRFRQAEGVADLVGLTSACALLQLSQSDSVVAAALAVAAAVGISWAFLAALANGLEPSERLLAQKVHQELALLRVGLASASLLALSEVPLWHLAWGAPLLMASQRQARNVLYRVQTVEAHSAIEKLKDSKRSLEQAQTNISTTRDVLRRTAQQRDLLEGFARQLAADPSPEEVGEALVATIEARIPFRSLVLFRDSSAHLEPFIYRSPEEERLRNVSLLNLREPLVELAWKDQKIRVSRPDQAQVLTTSGWQGWAEWDPATQVVGWDPDWSPDGSSIAFVGRNSGGGPALFVMKADGTDHEEVAPGGSLYRSPRFSPDSSMLVFVSDQGSGPEVYTVELSNLTVATQRTTDGTVKRECTWSPRYDATSGGDILYTEVSGFNTLRMVKAEMLPGDVAGPPRDSGIPGLTENLGAHPDWGL